MKSMFETRAQSLGISPKTMVARTKRTLSSVRKQLEPLAKQWGDIDNSAVTAHDRLLRAFDEYEKELAESIEWLNQQVEP